MSNLSAVLVAIESGAHGVKEIAAATGFKVESVHARLHELKRLGAVQSCRVPGGKHKRNPTQRQKRYSLITRTP